MEPNPTTEAAPHERGAGGLYLSRASGKRWTLEFDGQTCRLEQTGGVDLLATLIAHPDEQISALVLEHNFLHLVGMPPPSARLLLHDARERARAAVSRVMEETLAAIAIQHPALAQHLRASLRIGTSVAYAPNSCTSIP